MAEKKLYKNKNGNLSIENFVRLISSGEIQDFMKHHEVSKHSCPPFSLIPSDQMCFYWISCIKDCMSQVKEYKNHYQVGKVKYTKEDLDKLKEENV